jgi:hypothetical protein
VIAVSAPEEVEVALVSVPEAGFEYSSRRLGLSARVDRVYLLFVTFYQLMFHLERRVRPTYKMFCTTASNFNPSRPPNPNSSPHAHASGRISEEDWKNFKACLFSGVCE